MDYCRPWAQYRVTTKAIGMPLGGVSRSGGSHWQTFGGGSFSAGAFAFSESHRARNGTGSVGSTAGGNYSTTPPHPQVQVQILSGPTLVKRVFEMPGPGAMFHDVTLARRLESVGLF